MGDVSLLTILRELLIITRTLVWLGDAAGNQINISIGNRASCTLWYSVMNLYDRFSHLWTSDGLVILSLRHWSAWTSSSPWIHNPQFYTAQCDIMNTENTCTCTCILPALSYLLYIFIFLACCKFCKNEVNLIFFVCLSQFLWIKYKKNGITQYPT